MPKKDVLMALKRSYDLLNNRTFLKFTKIIDLAPPAQKKKKQIASSLLLLLLWLLLFVFIIALITNNT